MSPQLLPLLLRRQCRHSRSLRVLQRRQRLLVVAASVAAALRFAWCLLPVPRQCRWCTRRGWRTTCSATARLLVLLRQLRVPPLATLLHLLPRSRQARPHTPSVTFRSSALHPARRSSAWASGWWQRAVRHWWSTTGTRGISRRRQPPALVMLLRLLLPLRPHRLLRLRRRLTGGALRPCVASERTRSSTCSIAPATWTSRRTSILMPCGGRWRTRG